MSTPYPALDSLVRVYPGDAGPLSGVGLLWVHGGGFVIGDLDMPEADAVSRGFAARGALVVSVDYRLVADGENTFPAASDDVLRGWNWLVSEAGALGADRLFMGGTSAGGNLVAGAVLRMLGHEPAAVLKALPAGVFLGYPTLLAVQPAPTLELRAALDARPDDDVFTPAAVLAMYETYLGGDVADAPLPAIPGLAAAAKLEGFPPTIMVNCDVDELRMSGEAFAATLADAGVPVDLALQPGTGHGFLNRPEEAAFEATIIQVANWMAGR